MIDLTFRNINPNLAGDLSPPPPPQLFRVGLPLITQKWLKLQPWRFAVVSNILLETFVPKLVSLNQPRYWVKLRRGGIFWVSGQFLVKENCHNSRTSNDIGMRLGPVITLDKRIKRTSKKWRWRHVGKS